MAYKCSDGMCGADDCEICGCPEPEDEEEPDFSDDREPEHDEFINKHGIEIKEVRQ